MDKDGACEVCRWQCENGKRKTPSISIRLAFAKNGKLFIRSGAGIVADSIPENEYEECINKSKAVITALNIAKEGIY